MLNSRPLSSLSIDPNDLTLLTPAHFLIGYSITSQPEGAEVCVLIKNEHFPTTRWQIGSVEAIHPGSEGVVRVVDVRTPNGLFCAIFSVSHFSDKFNVS